MFKKSGYSLIELLIAISVISGIILLLSQAFITTTRTNTKVEVSGVIKQSGDFSLRRMEQLIMKAKSISSSCTGIWGTSLSLENQDGNQTTFQCAYDAIYGVTRIASVSATATEYLTPFTTTLGGIACTDPTMSLRFHCAVVAGAPNTVKILFRLDQPGAPVDQFEKSGTAFQGTVTLRN